MSAPPPDVAIMIQIGVTPDGKLLVNVNPPALDQFTLLGVLESVKLAVERKMQGEAAGRPGIVLAPPGLRV